MKLAVLDLPRAGGLAVLSKLDIRVGVVLATVSEFFNLKIVFSCLRELQKKLSLSMVVQPELDELPGSLPADGHQVAVDHLDDHVQASHLGCGLIV